VLAESQVPFAGLRLQERTGFAVAVAEAALQWEVMPNIFATALVDLGDVAPSLGEAVEHRVLGSGLSLGTRTLVGPVELRVHGRSPSAVLVEFSVGHLF
jgi:hypothetical protein